ncbi:MAG: PilZ domain-containing protein [Armatimonadota bacterium]|nr:PilZ domain-containing protein [Armatimonadota bacterium]MDR7466753.1 PilZ domain-containing protein [Armatimonadota bacterium]MDR7492773.1 PilZ domain-containing protein [Armatimonadota bacterium]MDR7498549.1 PilZ domain-containing protein [Armatimonadota bacterium]MDR7504328.1 PilZ domain-containing protein [Armatimonadota bacterium]
MYRPRVGERVMVEILPAGETYAGEVQEIADEHLIRLAVPLAEDGPLPDDADVRVTFVRKDGLYEEAGRVREIERVPEGRITIHLEGEAVRTQRRDFVRRDASLNAELTWNAQVQRCVTKDVSGGGVSLLFGQPPPFAEGAQFTVVLNIPDGRQPIRAQCQAKYVREVLRGSRYLVGSQFLQIAEDDRQRIVRFVFRLELSQRRLR